MGEKKEPLSGLEEEWRRGVQVFLFARSVPLFDSIEYLAGETVLTCY
jgi:hypothetical protein